MQLYASTLLVLAAAAALVTATPLPSNPRNLPPIDQSLTVYHQPAQNTITLVSRDGTSALTLAPRPLPGQTVVPAPILDPNVTHNIFQRPAHVPKVKKEEKPKKDNLFERWDQTGKGWEAYNKQLRQEMQGQRGFVKDALITQKGLDELGRMAEVAGNEKGFGKQVKTFHGEFSKNVKEFRKLGQEVQRREKDEKAAKKAAEEAAKEAKKAAKKAEKQAIRAAMNGF